ncbi:MAG: M23 family metallopeptidase [Mycetocola sp.]
MNTTLRLLRRPRSWVAVGVLVPALVVFGPAPAAADPGHEDAAAPAFSWDWPVAPPRPVLRPFVAPPTRYAAGHRGIDIGADPGDPVVAAAGGVVSFAGLVIDRPVISVRHPDGLVSSIEPVDAGVTAGDSVEAGEPIGTVAAGGHCDGRCVHVGVRLYGEYVNPLALLAEIDRAVLLPLGR